jgi:hypothetical protein
MDLSQAPAFVAAKMAMLSDARAAAATRSDELPAQISLLRDRLNGRIFRESDDPQKLRIEIEGMLVEQKGLHAQRPIEAGTIERCKRWLADLPAGTVLEHVAPVVEDGVSLSAVRMRIKRLRESAAALRAVPIPPSNIREKVRAHVQNMTRPVVSGINSGETLTMQWPANLYALMAFLQPEALVDRLMAEIERIANTPCPLPERTQEIAKLEEEIDLLQRTEEGIVMATGAPREQGCLPWVVLGVKAVEARGIRAA